MSHKKTPEAASHRETLLMYIYIQLYIDGGPDSGETSEKPACSGASFGQARVLSWVVAGAWLSRPAAAGTRKLARPSAKKAMRALIA